MAREATSHPLVVIACRYVEEIAARLSAAGLDYSNGWPLASFLLDLVDATRTVPKDWGEEAALAISGAAYARDGLITRHNAAFLFAEVLDEVVQSLPDARDIGWRLHVACWAADIGSRLPGDFVECGVNRGGTAFTVAKYVKFQNLPKRFYLLDTYCGLVPELLTEEERKAGLDDAYKGAYPDCYETCARLGDASGKSRR